MISFFQTAIPSIQSWQNPGSIRHHPETLQTPHTQANHHSIQHPIRIFASQSILFRYFLRSPVYVLGSEVIGQCLGGVWRVYGWCLIDLRYCQDCIDGITIDKKYLVSLYSNTAFPTDALHNAINRFDGVWKVSGRYQGRVWITLNNAWRIIMPDQLIKLQ